MQRALRVADRLAQDGVEAEVVDLRSLRPLDVDTVAESVRKTNRALVAEEGWSTYGVGAELAARIQRACFDDLDAPVERVGQAEVPMPYSKPLELAALPLEAKIEAAARGLLRVRAVSGGAVTDELVDAPPVRHDGGGHHRPLAEARGRQIPRGRRDRRDRDRQGDDGVPGLRRRHLLRILVGDGETAALGAPIAIVGEAGEEVAEVAARRGRPPRPGALKRRRRAPA